jgi:hypothetical protein
MRIWALLLSSLDEVQGAMADGIGILSGTISHMRSSLITHFSTPTATTPWMAAHPEAKAAAQ